MNKKKSLLKNKLAIFGGNKTIKNKFTHYSWPPKSKKKIQSVVNYLKKYMG